MQVAESSLELRPVSSPSTRPRLDWVDNLRTLMILFVVNVHACVTYSFVGSWYFNSPPEPSIPTKIPFLIWQAHLQAFFMGLLFFLGGYYADRSLARRGSSPFLSERARRLGLPALIFMLLIHPFIVFVLHPGYGAEPEFGRAYLHFLTSGRFLGASGPMWFTIALLIFCAAFVPLARWLPARSAEPLRLRAAPLLSLAAATGVTSFLVRTVQPLGSSVLNMQLCYFAQYVVAFALGVWVSRRDALATIAKSALARRYGWWALALGPVTLIAMLAASRPTHQDQTPAFMGGWNGSAFALAVWEQLVGFGLALGAMALCASRLGRRTPFSGWLSDRSFAVYLFHAPVLVAITLAVQPYRTNALIMAPAMTVVTVVASFGLADLARRVPALKTIL